MEKASFPFPSILTRIEDSQDLSRPSLTAAQSLVENLTCHFLSEIAHPASIAAMLVGGFSYRLGRIGILSFSEKRAFFQPALQTLFQGASYGVGLLAETGAFEMTHRLLLRLTEQDSSLPRPLLRWEGKGGIQEGLASSFLTFLSLRGMGAFGAGQNLFFQHFLQDAAVVFSHQAASRWGLMAAPEESLPEQFLKAEISQNQLRLATGLLFLFSPRVIAEEKILDLRLRSKERMPPEISSSFLDLSGPRLARAPSAPAEKKIPLSVAMVSRWDADEEDSPPSSSSPTDGGDYRRAPPGLRAIREALFLMTHLRERIERGSIFITAEGTLDPQKAENLIAEYGEALTSIPPGFPDLYKEGQLLRDLFSSPTPHVGAVALNVYRILSHRFGKGDYQVFQEAEALRKGFSEPEAPGDLALQAYISLCHRMSERGSQLQEEAQHLRKLLGEDNLFHVLRRAIKAYETLATRLQDDDPEIYNGAWQLRNIFARGDKTSQIEASQAYPSLSKLFGKNSPSVYEEAQSLREQFEHSDPEVRKLAALAYQTLIPKFKKGHPEIEMGLHALVQLKYDRDPQTRTYAAQVHELLFQYQKSKEDHPWWRSLIERLWEDPED
ncbi:MAG: hypothetical protein U1F57_02770 [bacterium]